VERHRPAAHVANHDRTTPATAAALPTGVETEALCLSHGPPPSQISREADGLWQILNGEVGASIDTLAKLALALDIDPVELVKRYRKPRPSSS